MNRYILASLLLPWLSLYAADTSPTENKVVIRADQARHTIDKNIYGHFSEHLGRCI